MGAAARSMELFLRRLSQPAQSVGLPVAKSHYISAKSFVVSQPFDSVQNIANPSSPILCWPSWPVDCLRVQNLLYYVFQLRRDVAGLGDLNLRG